MILQEESMQIRFLTEEGVSPTEIGRRLGVSRQTVYNHRARPAGEPFPRPRSGRRSKLDEFRGYVRSRLESFDLCSTVLLREIRAKGYTGSLTILRDFVRPLKAEFARRVTERFETRPGAQAQIDWGECGTIEVDGERRTLYVFVMVLGYSRMMYARFTTSSKLPVLLGCLARAFQALGIPAEILVDNMKQAVDQHDASTGAVRWNKRFLDFAEHHGVLPVASPPYWPRVKGKVERGIGYLKTGFLEGRSFTGLDDLNQQLEHWLHTVANVRIHGTTGVRPIDRHTEELPHLRPFAVLPAYDTRSLELRQVCSDSHISVGGVFYSVDPRAVGRSVSVRADGENPGDAFTIYLGAQRVGRHRRRAKGTPRVTLAEHAEAIRTLTRGQAANAYRRRGGQPHFLQIAAPDEIRGLRPLQISAPLVESRSLELYEAVLLQNGAT
jgi:transposase